MGEGACSACEHSPLLGTLVFQQVSAWVRGPALAVSTLLCCKLLFSSRFRCAGAVLFCLGTYSASQLQCTGVLPVEQLRAGRFEAAEGRLGSVELW